MPFFNDSSVNLKLNKKSVLAQLAEIEGRLCLKGGSNKSGIEIEKYLAVFRPYLGLKEPKYLSAENGYDWCCAYVYYLMQKSGYKLSASPVPSSNITLASVECWYYWALQEGIYESKTFEPAPGDLILFNNLIEGVELDHIGIVLKNNEKTILTTEGNFHNHTGIFNRAKNNTIRGYINLMP